MNETTGIAPRGRGFLVWIKSVAALTVLVLAAFSILFIFDVITVAQLKISVVRVLLAAGVVATAGTALAVLLGRGRWR
jgi:hypothetical protein